MPDVVVVELRSRELSYDADRPWDLAARIEYWPASQHDYERDVEGIIGTCRRELFDRGVWGYDVEFRHREGGFAAEGLSTWTLIIDIAPYLVGGAASGLTAVLVHEAIARLFGAVKKAKGPSVDLQRARDRAIEYLQIASRHSATEFEELTATKLDGGEFLFHFRRNEDASICFVIISADGEIRAYLPQLPNTQQAQPSPPATPQDST
jgi:hypothetical protein